ncbi:hypothetical protein [Bacillus sp. X1(2014)]|uniref:hypothetical protein n=1 Tax=Bacillus sp. X1(2014) TaxID=1565991 RepID=UPI001C92BCED|nr:hypothetical protein [Bacillus sp. X1(2014)]
MALIVNFVAVFHSWPIRTAFVTSKAILSEHRSSSDSFHDFKGNPVRTSVVFGQLS